MVSFNDISIKVKMNGGATAIALLFCVVAVTAYLGMRAINNNVNALYSQALAPTQEIADLQQAMMTIRGDSFKVLLLPKERAKMEANIQASFVSSQAALDSLKARRWDEVTAKELAKFETAWSGYKAGIGSLLGLVHAGQNRRALEALDDTGAVALERRSAGASLTALGKDLDAFAVAAREASRATFRRSVIWILAISLVAMLLTSSLSMFIGRSISEPMRRGVAMMRAMSEGELSGRMNLNRGDEVGALARSMDSFCGTLQGVCMSLRRVAKGDLSFELVPLSGRDEITPSLQVAKDNIQALARDAQALSGAAVEGRLAARAESGRHEGEYRRIVEGFNACLDAVVGPVNEAATVLEKVAGKDLSARVVGDYRGDHARIKDSLNKAVENLDQGLAQVAAASGQVAAASGQISTGSQNLSQGASKQAASIEEIGASLEQMDGQTRQNAASADAAKALAGETRAAAQKGNEAMDRMKRSIAEIKDSSDQTTKILKTIDEIAFQTNLLALNAAVEAARAGDAGMGFAVVAEEVRGLAGRSAEAARNTADLVGRCVRSAEGGVRITEEAAQALAEIVERAGKVNDLVGEIANASQDQTQGIGQINTGVSQLSQVIQANAATSEEAASASEELTGQAMSLEALVKEYTLSDTAGRPDTPAGRSRPARDRLDDRHAAPPDRGGEFVARQGRPDGGRALAAEACRA